jgi:hypothetical protein
VKPLNNSRMFVADDHGTYSDEPSILSIDVPMVSRETGK